MSADGPDYQAMLGSMDYAFLFAYAIGMFIRYSNDSVVYYFYCTQSRTFLSRVTISAH